MERSLKYFILSLVLMLGTSVFAEQMPVQLKPVVLQTPQQAVQPNIPVTKISPTMPQMVPFEQCTKKYNMPVHNLYYLALASLNANKFVIDEIQSKSGFVLFSVARRQFLLQVSKIDNKTSIAKITPADNNYYFPIGILTNFYKYIDLNLNAPVEKLN